MTLLVPTRADVALGSLSLLMDMLAMVGVTIECCNGHKIHMSESFIGDFEDNKNS